MVALKEMGISYDEDDLIVFFEKFDKDEKRNISYSEFCTAFAPKEEKYLKVIATRVPRNINLEMDYNEMFSDKTQELYKQVWLEHFACERETEAMRQQLLKNPFFDIQKAFKTIDTNSNGHITIDDVRAPFGIIIAFI